MDAALAAKRQEYIARAHSMLSGMRFLAAMLDKEGETSPWLDRVIAETERYVKHVGDIREGE